MSKKRTTTEKQEAPAVEEAKLAEEKQPIELPESETPVIEETPPETPPVEEEKPIRSERACPFETTVGVSLAVLRKNIGPGTEDMLKPVATLKQGTKVTVTAIYGEYAQIRNGLWIALEHLAEK